MKTFIYFYLLLLSLHIKAESPPPFYTESKIYKNTDKYCFPQGAWSGDFRNFTMRYHLLSSPNEQGKYSDIFLGFRQKSQLDKLWLFGFSVSNAGVTTPSNWVQYDKKQTPVVYAMGQNISAVTKINIIEKAVNLQALEGDGEILIGYGLRNNMYTTSPTDSFEEMLSNNRFKVIFQFDSNQPVNFGNWTCIQFNEILQQVNGIK